MDGMWKSEHLGSSIGVGVATVLDIIFAVHVTYHSQKNPATEPLQGFMQGTDIIAWWSYTGFKHYCIIFVLVRLCVFLMQLLMF